MESQITICGYVGTDVEYSSGKDQNGQEWHAARFRLGCTPYWRKGADWVNGITSWMSIRVSGITAQNVHNSVHKGEPLIVSGRLRTKEWKAADGSIQQQLVIEASSLGHDMARGQSMYMRPGRDTALVMEEAPLGPYDDLDNPSAMGSLTVDPEGQSTDDVSESTDAEGGTIDQVGEPAAVELAETEVEPRTAVAEPRTTFEVSEAYAFAR